VLLRGARNGARPDSLPELCEQAPLMPWYWWLLCWILGFLVIGLVWYGMAWLARTKHDGWAPKG